MKADPPVDGQGLSAHARSGRSDEMDVNPTMPDVQAPGALPEPPAPSRAVLAVAIGGPF